MKTGRIVKVSGPLVVADNMQGGKMFDMVFVSEDRLVGEIIELAGDTASIQVYEETGGMGIGAPVYMTDHPLSVELGPGLIESIYDGIQRPLDVIAEKAGDYITRGITANALDREKQWEIEPKIKTGDEVTTGDTICTVQESPVVLHKVMVPPGVSGKVKSIVDKGKYKIEDIIAVLQTEDGKEIELDMIQRWPVRQARPIKKKLLPQVPLVTGQRVIDTFFTVTKGGTACVPGPFGSGKTVVQHQLAKWADADIIVYVGCGERGNEMTDVLIEFPELEDPKSGYPLMKRTVLIANTSNMPVAARSASIYTGITIAEYFRDMGYSVALMADSTSRWAEALREISGRLEEMPGEEGYPAYLGRSLAEFYERSGDVVNLGKEESQGQLTLVGAVSPPGGDLSDPVVQNTLRVVRVFWSLDDKLADQRHFPSISWIRSYTLYTNNVNDWFVDKFGEEFIENRDRAMKLLQEETELREFVRLVGAESLPVSDRLTLIIARSIREDFLQQHAFHAVDTYCSMEKQVKLLALLLYFGDVAEEAIDAGVQFSKIENMPIREDIGRAKNIPEDEIDEKFGEIRKQIDEAFNKLREEAVV
ncbi:MAG: V-type ATP synthase subunit A [Candidatus Zixiibacteriota bacterium]